MGPRLRDPAAATWRNKLVLSAHCITCPAIAGWRRFGRGNHSANCGHHSGRASRSRVPGPWPDQPRDRCLSVTEPLDDQEARFAAAGKDRPAPTGRLGGLVRGVNAVRAPTCGARCKLTPLPALIGPVGPKWARYVAGSRKVVLQVVAGLGGCAAQ